MSHSAIKLRKGISKEERQPAAQEAEQPVVRVSRNPSPIGIWYTINFEQCESLFNRVCEATEFLLQFKTFVEQQEVWRHKSDEDVQRLLLEYFQSLHQWEIWLEIKLNEAVKTTFSELDIRVGDFAGAHLPPMMHHEISEIEALRFVAEGFYRLTGVPYSIGKHLDELREKIFSVRPKWRGRPEWREFYIDIAILPRDLTESVKRFLKLLDAELEKQRDGGKGKARAAGRPPAWDWMILHKELIRAGQILYRDNQRIPTLKEMAREMSKRRPITEGALKMTLRRHKINWKEFKNNVFRYGPRPEILKMAKFGDE